MASLAPASPGRHLRQQSALPGLGLALGITIASLTLVIMLPLAALVLRAGGVGMDGFARLLGDPRVLAAFRTTFGLSLLAACIDAVFGLVIAWVITRYRFAGRRLLDAAVDLPFALPTAVAGIALSALYAPNGWLGAPLGQLGIKVAYTPLGILMALIFVGLPFVVRTVQPIIAELEREVEEASATLGATRLQTLRRVIFPTLAPALLTGFALTFARAVGEYGSVIFIAGNVPYVSEIIPLLIVVKLEEYDYAGATAIATAMLAVSFAILLALNLLQSASRRRYGYV